MSLEGYSLIQKLEKLGDMWGWGWLGGQFLLELWIARANQYVTRAFSKIWMLER